MEDDDDYLPDFLKEDSVVESPFGLDDMVMPSDYEWNYLTDDYSVEGIKNARLGSLFIKLTPNQKKSLDKIRAKLYNWDSEPSYSDIFHKGFCKTEGVSLSVLKTLEKKGLIKLSKGDAYYFKERGYIVYPKPLMYAFYITEEDDYPDWFIPEAKEKGLWKAESKKINPIEKAGLTGVASGATMEGLETLLAAEDQEDWYGLKVLYKETGLFEVGDTSFGLSLFGPEGYLNYTLADMNEKEAKRLLKKYGIPYDKISLTEDEGHHPADRYWIIENVDGKCFKHEWSNDYVRDTEYDGVNKTGGVTFGQRCLNCDVERRGSVRSDVHWDMAAEDEGENANRLINKVVKDVWNHFQMNDDDTLDEYLESPPEMLYTDSTRTHLEYRKYIFVHSADWDVEYGHYDGDYEPGYFQPTDESNQRAIKLEEKLRAKYNTKAISINLEDSYNRNHKYGVEVSYNAETLMAAEMEKKYFHRYGFSEGGKEWGEITFEWMPTVNEWMPYNEDDPLSKDDLELFREEKEYELVNEMLNNENSRLHTFYINNPYYVDEEEFDTKYEVLNEDGEIENLGFLISWGEPEIEYRKSQYSTDPETPLYRFEFLDAEEGLSEKQLRDYFALLKAQNPDLARKIEFSVKNEDELPTEEIEKAGFDEDKIEAWVDLVGVEDSNLVGFEGCSTCEGEGYVLTSYTSATRFDPADGDGEDCGECGGTGMIDPADYMDKEGQYYAETFDDMKIKYDNRDRTFFIKSVDYDTDGEIENDKLPQEFTIKIPSDYHYFDENADEGDITDVLNEWISTETGFSTKGIVWIEEENNSWRKNAEEKSITPYLLGVGIVGILGYAITRKL